MAVTIQDIARRASVSHMTVSLVLNNKGGGRVSDATRQRVLAAARDSGYSPNRAAQALATGGRTRTVAIWIRRFASRYYGEMLGEFERRLDADGYSVTARGFGSDRTELAEWPVDGIIAMDHAHARSVGPQDLARGAAFVSVGAYVDPAWDHVAVDFREGVRAAVRHLYDQGCRRIAHVLNAGFLSGGDARREAYLAAMADLGLPPEIVELPDDRREAVPAALAEYIRERGSPDGLICRNDEIAIGSAFTLRRLGCRIPDDVCLVGCDGIVDAEFLEVPLTTLAVPTEEVCGQAWAALRRRIETPDAPLLQTTITPPLLVRASSLRIR